MSESTKTVERERFQQLSRLFEAARDLSEPELGSFIRNVEDPWLRDELAAMIRLDREGTPTIQTLVDLSQVLEEPESRVEVPARIGEYKVLGVIGFGASGVVLRARQPETDRVVAIKVLGSGAWNPGALQRFRREIRLLGRLEHPGIARIYDSGTDTAVVPARPYFVMEYVDGTPLNRWAADDGSGARRSPQEIARVFAAIADAIHYAHEAGVVHRDLKPGNLLVTKKGSPKVLDFGVSGVFGGGGLSSAGGSSPGGRKSTSGDVPTQSLLSLGEAVVGTVPYMSPEQFDGTRSVDRRSDLYSIGVMLFECLAGRLPYAVDPRALTEAATVIRDEVPSTLGRVDRSLRGDLETVVARLLEKEPERRYQSADELALDLRLFGEGKPTRTRPIARAERVRRFTSRYQALIAATALAFATLLGFLGYTLHLWRESESQRAELARALETSERLEYRRAIRDAEAALRAGAILDARRALSSLSDKRRGWEWRYLAARVGAESQVVEIPLMPIAIATRGDVTLVGNLRGGVYRLHADGSEPTTLAVGKASTSEVAISPDGAAFVMVDAAEASLPVRSTKDGALLRKLPLSNGSTSVDWSADGARIAVAGLGGSVVVLDASSGDVERALPPLALGARLGEGLVRFIPGGAGILYACRASTRAVISHDRASTPIELDLEGGVVERVGLCMGRDGLVALVGLYNGEIAIFDAASGRPLRRIRAHAGALRAITPGPGPSEFASGATDGTIRIWNVDSGEAVGTAIGAELQVRGLAFDHSRRELLSAGEDGFVRRWDIVSSVREPVLREHRAWVYCLEFIDDGTSEGMLVSGAGEAPALDGRVAFWNLGERSLAGAINPIREGATNIVWSITGDPQGEVICASGDGIQFVTRKGVTSRFSLPTSPFRVALLDGGNRVAVRRFESRALELYDRAGTLIQSIELPHRSMDDMRTRAGGTELIVGSGSALLWFKIENGRAFETRRIEFEGLITSISTIETADLVAVGLFGGDVALVDASGDGGASIRWRKPASPDDNVRVALSPDGTRVSSVGKGTTVRILDASDGEQVLALGGHGDAVISIAYSLDGSTLATGSIDGTIRIWRAAATSELSKTPLRSTAQGVAEDPPSSR